MWGHVRTRDARAASAFARTEGAGQGKFSFRTEGAGQGKFSFRTKGAGQGKFSFDAVILHATMALNNLSVSIVCVVLACTVRVLPPTVVQYSSTKS